MKSVVNQIKERVQLEFAKIRDNFLLILKALEVEEVSGLARAQVQARALWAESFPLPLLAPLREALRTFF